MGFLASILGSNKFNPNKISHEIIITSLKLGDAYIKKSKDNADTQMHCINEFIYFFLHHLNRLAYLKGGVKGQERIYDKVVHATIASLNEMVGSDASEIILEGIADAEMYYANFKGTDLLQKAAFRICDQSNEKLINSLIAMELVILGMKSLKLDKKI
jgi:hypothetical protein